MFENKLIKLMNKKREEIINIRNITIQEIKNFEEVTDIEELQNIVKSMIAILYNNEYSTNEQILLSMHCILKHYSYFTYPGSPIKMPLLRID